MPHYRDDHTDYLVHWTKGTYQEAFDALTSIAIDETIYSSSSNIRSGDNCICFSEAPIESFHQGGDYFQPFGIRVSKRWLFSLEGRPVIYQPPEEYSLLPKELKWRHVDFNLTGKGTCNFTWQREWQSNQMSFIFQLKK